MPNSLFLTVAQKKLCWFPVSSRSLWYFLGKGTIMGWHNLWRSIRISKKYQSIVSKSLTWILGNKYILNNFSEKLLGKKGVGLNLVRIKWFVLNSNKLDLTALVWHQTPIGF